MNCSTKRIQMRTILYIICLAFSANANSFTYYVSHSGSDHNDGLSWDRSWRTLKYAGMKAKAGDTVIIRKGSKPYLYLPISNSGTKDHPIKFRGELQNNPPVITGAVNISKFSPTEKHNVWSVPTTAEPHIVIENNKAKSKATSKRCDDGTWFWENNVFYYKLTSGLAKKHNIWRASMGGGIQIGDNSWIVIEDIECRIGQGACIKIGKGQNNIVRRIKSKWYVRGIQISGGGYNTVEDCIVEENRDGIYLMDGAFSNLIRKCKVIRNGNAPIWSKNDRAGIAIGNTKINPDNVLVDNEVAFNGGPNSDPGLIAYQAPRTIIENNYIHDNYGSGVFITISSDNSVVTNNRVINNGELAVKAGHKNISGLSVRRSRGVRVENNTIISNYVSSDTWRGGGKIDKGPRGGLDLRGNKGDDMREIKFINNLVCKTQNGPNIYISMTPNTSGLVLKNPADMHTNCLNQ